MKIIKPLKLSLLKKTYTFLGQHHLVVSPLLFFRLGSGQILTEMPQWPVMEKSLGPLELFDMAMPKIQAELLVAGKAFAPENQPVQTMPVNLSIGPIEKRLSITGNRQWQRGLMPLETVSDPEPFLSMPLHAANAYGGESFALNPVGKGYLPRKKRLLGKSISVELPNIESPDQPFKKISQPYLPASIGPIGIELEPRAKKAGTYDDHWQKNHFPGYAPDMDWSIFNAAPEDQQIKGFWQGGEHYCIQGMHPQHQNINGALPSVKARSFIRNHFGEFKEIDLVADTVWLFPEHLLGAIIFRGQTSIDDSDGLDIETLLLAYEKTQDKRRSVDYYQQVMTLRTDKKTEFAHLFNEAQLSPVKNVEQLMQEQQEVEQEQQRQKDFQQRAVAEIMADQDLPENTKIPDPSLSPLPVLAPEAIKRADIDLSQLLEKIDQEVTRVKEQGEQQLADLKEQTAQIGITIDTKERQKKEEQKKSPAEIKQQCTEVENKILQQPDKFHTPPKKPGLEASHLMNKPELIKSIIANTAPEDHEMPDSNTARRYAMDASEPAETLAKSTQNKQRNLILELLATGKTLAGRDLAGADLSGMDFSNMDLREVLLEKSNLDNCNFSHANMSGATLTEATLNNCQFVNTNLSQANLCKAKAWAANFSEANFNNARLISAKLQNCRFNNSHWHATTANNLDGQHSDFSGSTLKRCILIQAQLVDSDWINASISETLMIEVNLNYARCQNITLHRSALIKASANIINLEGANLNTVQTGGHAEFLRANFQGAHITQSGFRTTDMRASNFSNSQISQCDFGDSDLSYSNFNNSQLPQCILTSAKINHSTFINSNFYSVTGRKVKAYKTRFDNSNFLYSDWQQAQWKQCHHDNVKNLNTTALELSA